MLPSWPAFVNLRFFGDGVQLGNEDLLPILEASLSDGPAVEN